MLALHVWSRTKWKFQDFSVAFSQKVTAVAFRKPPFYPHQMFPDTISRPPSLFSPEGTWKEGLSGPKSSLPQSLLRLLPLSLTPPVSKAAHWSWPRTEPPQLMVYFLGARVSPISCLLPEPRRVPVLPPHLCQLSSVCTTFGPSPYLRVSPVCAHGPLTAQRGGGHWTSMAPALLWHSEKLTVPGDGWQRASGSLCL